jgi:hypothetical protein
MSVMTLTGQAICHVKRPRPEAEGIPPNIGTRLTAGLWLGAELTQRTHEKPKENGPNVA